MALLFLCLLTGLGTSVSKCPMKVTAALKTDFGVQVIVMMTPILINRIHWRTYIIFTITNASTSLFSPDLVITAQANNTQALFVPAVYFFYPETSNISLEDIDKIFLPASMQGYASRHNSVTQHPDVKHADANGHGSVSSKGDDADHTEKADMNV